MFHLVYVILNCFKNSSRVRQLFINFVRKKGTLKYVGANMLKQVGKTKIQAKHKATCHCGSVDLDGIRIIKGSEYLKLYEFNTATAKHYFCSNCGIYTHHQRRSNPNEYGFNIACLEGVNPFDLGDVVTNDGVNHPADR